MSRAVSQTPNVSARCFSFQRCMYLIGMDAKPNFHQSEYFRQVSDVLTDGLPLKRWKEHFDQTINELSS